MISDKSTVIGVLNVLVDFNTIIDTDFGLLTLIDRKYLDKDLLSVDWFNKHHTIKELTKALYTRTCKNPLHLCNISMTEDEEDSLYDDFMSKKYDEILKLSMITSVYEFLNQLKISGDIGITIVCNNEKEIDLLNSLSITSKMNKILLFDLDIEKTLLNYHQFLFKYIDSGLITYLTDLVDKTIYVASYGFNIDQERHIIINNDYTLNLSYRRNIFKIMDLYDLSKINEQE